jgi:hypothetical protein
MVAAIVESLKSPSPTFLAHFVTALASYLVLPEKHPDKEPLSVALSEALSSFIIF